MFSPFFLLSFVAKSPERIVLGPDNSYLKSLDRVRHGNGYLGSLESPRVRSRVPVRVKVPLVVPSENSHNQTFASWFTDRRKDETKASKEGNFRIEPTTHNTTFDRVGGYQGVKEELLQIMDMLKNSAVYEEYGVRLPKGILLEGPTGNGKTLLARAFSGEIDFPLIATSGAEFNEKYVGVGASRVRELFEFAGENCPCIIFIDEIDALARKRQARDDGSGDERCQTLNQLLVALDGFQAHNGIIVMAATNRIDILDPAVIRPGRMDKIIHVPNPDMETRREIVNIHRLRKPINATTEDIVRLTSGMNGAQIENMLNEATLTAIRGKSLPVELKRLEETRNAMILGQSIGQRNLSDETLRRIAIHETGHLLMALESAHFDRPSKVTIDSSVFSSLGYTVFEQSEAENGFFLREYLVDHLKVLLGGRVAEEIIYGASVSSGAFSDLETAFGVAKKMVMEYGMGTHIIYPHFSETYRKEIDQQIHRLIVSAYKETQRIMLNNKERLLGLATLLLDKKTLYPADFAEKLNPVVSGAEEPQIL